MIMLFLRGKMCIALLGRGKSLCFLMEMYFLDMATTGLVCYHFLILCTGVIMKNTWYYGIIFYKFIPHK